MSLLNRCSIDTHMKSLTLPDKIPTELTELHIRSEPPKMPLGESFQYKDNIG